MYFKMSFYVFLKLNVLFYFKGNEIQFHEIDHL
jgi:hypothetical protein